MIGIEKEIFSETYKFLIKYCDGENTPEFWENVIDDCRRIHYLFEGHPLATDLLIACISQLQYRVADVINGLKCFKTYQEWDTLKEKFKKPDIVFTNKV